MAFQKYQNFICDINHTDIILLWSTVELYLYAPCTLSDYFEVPTDRLKNGYIPWVCFNELDLNFQQKEAKEEAQQWGKNTTKKVNLVIWLTTLSDWGYVYLLVRHVPFIAKGAVSDMATWRTNRFIFQA